jgi:hypothetical protein
VIRPQRPGRDPPWTGSDADEINIPSILGLNCVVSCHWIEMLEFNQHLNGRNQKLVAGCVEKLHRVRKTAEKTREMWIR